MQNLEKFYNNNGNEPGDRHSGQHVGKLRDGAPAADEAIIRFSDTLSASIYSSVLSDYGFSLKHGTTALNYQLIDLQGAMPLARALELLEAHPLVESAEPNYRLSAGTVEVAAIPGDPRFNSLWGLHNIGQTGGTIDADIDAPEAWETTTGGAVVVGVIDTGIDYTHPDLASNMWVNAGEIPDNGIDDDGNGFVDDVHGYDFANDDGDPMDGDGHGTHVAGTIAARGDNGTGVAGVTWSARIMALKFLGDDGTGSTFDAIRAIDYAIMMGADITNNSWGGYDNSIALRNAIERAGAAGQLFLAAAGNEENDNDRVPSYPASYDLPNIVSVAASDHRDHLASFSNTGEISVDLAAPGVAILSTVPGGGYASLSGTSMASPHVAGAAALLLSAEPGLSAVQLKERLLASVDPIADLAGEVASGGRLNIANAMSDGPATPALSITADNPARPEGDSGTTAFTFTVSLSGDASAGATAEYAVTGSGSFPANGADFAGSRFPSGAVTVADGETSATITVAVQGDTEAEPDEGFAVTLSNPTDGVIISRATATGTIRNDDVPPDGGGETGKPAFANLDGTVYAYPYIDESVGTRFRADDDLTVDALGVFDEGGDGLARSYRVVLFDADGDPLAEADITGGTGAPLEFGTRWAALATSVSLAAGEVYVVATYRPDNADPFGWAEAGEFDSATEIVPLDDVWDFGNSGDGITPIFPSDSEVLDAIIGPNFRIVEDTEPEPEPEPADPPVLTIAAADASGEEGDSGTRSFTFLVTRSGDTAPALTVDWAVAGQPPDAADAADFGGTLPGGSLSFAAGDTAETIGVTVNGDSAVEPDEQFVVTLSNPSGDAEIAVEAASGTILNDDETPPEPEPPDASPNVYGILMEGVPPVLLSTGTVARMIDASGGQSLLIRPGASLELQGAAGGNIVELPGIAAGFFISHDVGATSLIGPGGELVVLDARTTAQTLVFDDGALDLRIVGDTVRAGSQIVTEDPVPLSTALEDRPALPGRPDTPPAEPNYLAILDTDAPAQLIAGGIHASMIDAAGGQTYHVDRGASLDVQGTNGGNTLSLQAAAGDVAISREVGNVRLDGPQGEVVTFDARVAPQTLIFLDGALEITIVGDAVMAGEQPVTEIPTPLTATLDPEKTSEGVFDGEGSGRVVSIDGLGGSQDNPAASDAPGDAFRFTDAVGQAGFADMVSFGHDDTIRFFGSVNGAPVAADVVNVDPGPDTEFTRNGGGIVSRITLDGVSAGLSLQTVADFNASADLGDVLFA